MTSAVHDLDQMSVLVLEDDYYIATDLQAALEEAGATVVGPFSNEADAMAAVTKVRPDCALVDVNLGNGASFEMARRLRGLEVPFAFVTGYDQSVIPEEFSTIERLEKPVGSLKLLAVTSHLGAGQRAAHSQPQEN